VTSLPYFVTLLVGIATVLAIGIIVIQEISYPNGDLGYSASMNETLYRCCNGNVCTDTYWDAKTNECVLVLCENNALARREECRYPGRN
jgi:hypothetical protein